MSTDKPHDRCLTTSSQSKPLFPASWIGKPVKEILARQKSFSIRGVTSRGVFLETEGGWITFLSNEVYRGPLTLNIQNYQQIPWVEPGLRGSIDQDIIAFDNLDVCIGYGEARVWSTSNRIVAEQNQKIMAMRNIRADSLVNKLLQLREFSNEYLDAARRFFFSAAFDQEAELAPRLEQITRAFLTRVLPPAEGAVNFLVGRGLGLTPSGDDFLSGILFGLAVSGQFQHDSGVAFRDFILAAIQLGSTTISARLAECAAAGEVDERIFTAADYLVNGNSSEQTAIEGILSWGSSSGADTIAGFLVGLKMVELRAAGDS
jgi:hypothetical protein